MSFDLTPCEVLLKVKFILLKILCCPCGSSIAKLMNRKLTEYGAATHAGRR